MRRLALTTVILLACPSPGWAQESPRRPLGAFLTTAGSYDSNVEHDVTSRGVYGGAVGLGFRLQLSGRRQSLEARYEAAWHRYSGATKWNRLSQAMETDFGLKLAGWLRLHALLEATLKGNSEDRDLGDEYTAKPRLELRPAAGTAIRLFGAYRLKRDESDREQDATNTYYGLELRQRLVGDGVGRLAVRREANLSQGTEGRYHRTMYSLSLSTRPEAATVLEWSLKYRSRQYDFRRVTLGAALVPREDRRVTTDLSLGQRLGHGLSIQLGYEFEARGSNDASKEYLAHLVSLVVVQQW